MPTGRMERRSNVGVKMREKAAQVEADGNAVGICVRGCAEGGGGRKVQRGACGAACMWPPCATRTAISVLNPSSGVFPPSPPPLHHPPPHPPKIGLSQSAAQSCRLSALFFIIIIIYYFDVDDDDDNKEPRSRTGSGERG